MHRPSSAAGTVALALAVSLGTGIALPVSAHERADGRPATYQLDGDPGGSKFEGIGVDREQETFYVSEVTGGDIHGAGSVR